MTYTCCKQIWTQSNILVLKDNLQCLDRVHVCWDNGFDFECILGG